MKEEDSLNKIKSVYNHKPILLLSFKKNKKYNSFNYIANQNRERKNNLIHSKNKLINRPKSSINKIDVFFTSNKEPNTIKNLKNNSNTSHKNRIEQEFISDKNSILLLGKSSKNNYVKKNKIIYLLRKLFIILPSDKKQMHIKNYPADLYFYFYFPIRIVNSIINIDFIKSPKKSDVLCEDLNHILHETYKYLKLCIYDSIKMEIYDEKFSPIIKESQLFINKKRIIYIKITNLKEKEFISWRKRLESKLFPVDDNYLLKQEKKITNNQIPTLYRDVSTEYNFNDTRTISNYKNKTVINNSLLKKINFTDNYLNYDYNSTNHNTIFRTFSQESQNDEFELNIDYLNDNYEHEIIDNIFVSADEKNFLSLKKSRKSLTLFSKNLIKKVLNNENKNKSPSRKFILSFNEKDEVNKNYNSNINNNSKLKNRNLKENNYLEEMKNEKNKDNNILLNIIKRNKMGKTKDNLLSPLLFDFDVNDFINNKYILKYLSNKNKENYENTIYQIKCGNFKIKNLNEEDSNSHRKIFIKNKSKSLLYEKTNLKNNNNNFNNEEIDTEEMIKSLLEENKEKYYIINDKIKEFIINDIDNLFTNEEANDNKSLNCNYILINDLKEFPISKLKKEFLLFACLSQRSVLKYSDLFNKIDYILLKKKEDIKNIFLLDDFANFLIYLDEIFTKIKNNKMYLFRYIGYSNKEVKINYLFFILFLIYNKSLLDKNVDINLIYLAFECCNIAINSEINFQQYCDYKLVMTKNNFINYNKKFNFIKDLILRVLVNAKFNKQIMIEKLKTIFDININDIKNIYKFDMCTVKLKQNIGIYNKVGNLYEEFINYYGL